MTSQILDHGEAEGIAVDLIAQLEDAGFSPEEMIPGLVQAIVVLADNDDEVLDEAAALLADGGVVTDYD